MNDKRSGKLSKRGIEINKRKTEEYNIKRANCNNNLKHSKLLDSLGQKKVILFPEIGRVKTFLLLTRPHSQMCIRIYIFYFTKKSKKTKSKRN